MRGRVRFSVERSFWLTAALLAWSGSGLEEGRLRAAAAGLWLTVVFLAVAFHEAGHAAAALSFGAGVEVRLHGFGGETTHRPPLPWGRRMVVTAAGPAAGFLLAGLAHLGLTGLRRAGVFAALGYPAGALAAYGFLILRDVCLAWSLFNLLPVAPLDGGALAASGLQRRYGLPGLKAALGLGLVGGGAVALYLFAAGQRFNALIVGYLALSNVGRLKQLQGRVPQDDDPALQEELKALLARMDAGHKDAATARRLYRLSRRAGLGVIHRAAAGELGLLFAAQGRPRAAYALLSPLESSLTAHGRKLLQRMAYDTGRYERAIELGQELLSRGKDADAALLTAQACAKKGDARGAAKWLKTAFSLDESLRRRPEAAELLRSLGG